MANTKVPIELSSTPGIIDNSTATAITIDSAGAATFSGTVTANGLTVGDGHTIGNDGFDNLLIQSSLGEGIRLISNHATNPLTIESDVGFVFKTLFGTTRFEVAGTGNVGIGISSPVSPLQIQNDDPQVVMTQTAGGVNRFLAFDVGLAADVDTQFITVDQADNLAFGEKLTASDRVIENEWMRITSAGLVGIGTSLPTGLLHLAADNAHVISKVMASTTGYDAELWLGRNDTRKAIIKAEQISANSDHDLVFFTNGPSADATEKMRITSAGNLGIGTNTPAYQLTLSSNPSFWEAGLQTEVVGGNQVLKVVSDAFGGGGRTGNIEFHVNSVSASPAVKINASGHLLVGTTAPAYTEKVSIGMTTANQGIAIRQTDNANANDKILFVNTNGIVGYIRTTGSATAYSTSSDYRLKEDDVPMTGATERVKALRPINFAWKVDGSRTDGFFAHEAQEVVPECSTGTKDAMRDEEYEVTPAVEEVKDEDGNVTTEAIPAVMGTRSVPDYQGIDQSKLVPLLTAALQEAIAKIEALTARIEALEGA